MIKEHVDTGLKYLCYTRSEGSTYANYKGSGTLWKRHLKKYGDNITTELIFETADKELFKKTAIEYSQKWNIVESDDWANLKIEEGDGGDTVSNKMWITDGSTDKYILKDDVIPDGWYKGRSKCVFNDPSKQREFASRVDSNTRGQAIKKAWADGKMDHRKHAGWNIKQTPERRQQQREWALERSQELSKRAKESKFWLKSNRWQRP